MLNRNLELFVKLALQLEVDFQKLDVLSLLNEKRKYGMSPLLFSHLKDEIFSDSEIQEHVNKTLVDNTARYELLQNEIERLSESLEKEGVFHVVLKGNDFTDRLYYAKYERRSHDIDILVAADELWKANFIIRNQGYSQMKGFFERESSEGRDAIFSDDTPESRIENAMQLYLKRDHDALSLRKSFGDDAIEIDLHQTKNFRGIDINPIFEQSIAKKINGEKKTYNVVNDIDVIIICAWHLYHHLMGHVFDEKDYELRNSHLKEISDLYRALLAYKDKYSVEAIAKRIVETNASMVVIFALKKTQDLFEYINADCPSFIEDLKGRLIFYCPDIIKVDRLLDNYWQYGSRNFHFWEWMLQPYEYIEIIKSEISALRNRGHLDYHIYDSYEHAEIWRVYEAPYYSERDRLKSFIKRDWGLEPIDLRLQFKCWHSNIGLHFCFWDSKDISVLLSLMLAENGDVASKDYDTFKILLFSGETKICKMNNNSYSFQTKHECSSNKYYYVFIPAESISFSFDDKNFAMRLLFEIVDTSDFPIGAKNCSTILSWPRGIIGYASIHPTVGQFLV